ncbi:hypothetical protein EMIT0P218_150055 [Pseudomonas sp. IT-P218]
MLAKNLRAPRGVRLPASSLTSIASKLAPTGKSETIGGRYRRNGYTPNPNIHLKPSNLK